jgi:hypothetical protein
VVLIELEERHVGSNSGHRSSSVEDFLLAPININPLPLSGRLVGFNWLCDLNVTWRNVL